MSGDIGKDQPIKFYSKEPTDSKDTLLLSGKVKTVYEIANEVDKVNIHFHDKVTAGNGRLVEYPEGKGKVCCLISALLFEHLEKFGIPSEELPGEGAVVITTQGRDRHQVHTGQCPKILDYWVHELICLGILRRLEHYIIL